jgi:hypothetical protein
MKTDQAILLKDATNINREVKNDKTIFTFDSGFWPGKKCMHVIPGVWEITSIEGNVVNLANYDNEPLTEEEYADQEPGI